MVPCRNFMKADSVRVLARHLQFSKIVFYLQFVYILVETYSLKATIRNRAFFTNLIRFWTTAFSVWLLFTFLYRG